MHSDASGKHRPISPDVLEQAANWLLRLNELDASDSEREACEQWRRQHPEHARAWAKAERLRGLLATIPAKIAHPVLDRSMRMDRRAVLRNLGAVLLLAPGSWLAWRLWDQADWDHSLSTAVGERSRQRLPDGSQLQLDTGTTLDFAFGPQQRLIRLREGQILIDTATDPQQPARPFRVVTAHGRMQALGTRFNVRSDAERTWLTVLQGAVRVEPDGRAELARRVDAGQKICFGTDGYGSVQAADAASVTWSHGMLTADALPLQQLVDELSRYRRGILHCDPELALLPVSGAFPLDDTDRSLGMLTATYPISLERRAGGWWTVLRKRRD